MKSTIINQSGLDLNDNEKFELVLKYYNLWEPEGHYMIVCPFHGDNNPSMSINLIEGKFYCFGCNAVGDVYDFIKYANKDKSPFEQMRILSSIINNKKISKELLISNDINYKANKTKNIKADKDYYYNLKVVDWFNVETEDEYKVKKYLKQRGYKPKILNETGCKLNDDSNYPILFPIFDNEIFRGYIKRTMSRRIAKQRKYMYNTGFRRSCVLAGDYDNDVVIIVEGLLDKIKANQLGLKYVAATLGWKLSEKQKQKLIKSGVKKIICATDNDEAGRRGYRYLKSLDQFEVVRLHYPKFVKDMGDVDKQIYKQVLKQQIQKHGGF